MSTERGGDTESALDLVRLVQQLPHLKGFKCRQAADVDLDRFEQRFKMQLPTDLRAWLKCCNGVPLSGGMFGINQDRSALDISRIYEFLPDWQENRWIPIGGDGNGNYYLVRGDRQASESYVYLFDHEFGGHEPICVVASGVLPFARAIITHEINVFYDYEPPWWPLDERRVLENDPELAEYTGPLPFAWQVSEYAGILKTRTYF